MFIIKKNLFVNFISKIDLKVLILYEGKKKGELERERGGGWNKNKICLIDFDCQ